ncbi:xanthine dehydrogenase family protein molybdopterin-binding subunit [Prosthecomicrobium sp. N25]|uniref:xanthine dehydrogenase family protein molybdopterin-binding subunit n=1 Tax=Prosthecomicrobium sp. N25 TaxID=3129254 RepID=UPI00307712E4
MSVKDLVAEIATPTRRAVLGNGAAALAGLVLAVDPSEAFAKKGPRGGTGTTTTATVAGTTGTNIAPPPTGTAVGSWVVIAPDNTITILAGSQEMGQGILSGLAQVLAEELFVDWAKVRVEHAPSGNFTYSGPNNRGITAGSGSMRGYYQGLRLAGARAREMLKMAAVAKFGGTLDSAVCADGVVTVNGQSATYGALATLAATQAAPATPPLIGSGRLIGKVVARPDIPPKVDGSAVFGIDVRLPNMLYACVKHSPVHGGTVPAGYNPPLPSGAVKVVNLGTAVAVVAGNTWAARKGAESLSVSWILPSGATAVDTPTIDAAAQSLMATGTPAIAETLGDAPGAILASARQLDLTYSVPFMAHATLEPLTCTVLYTTTACEVWASTQAPNSIVGTVTKLTGLPATAIQVHPQYMGGGMGRKFEQDFVIEAVKIAQAVPGRPVKLTWTREEDMTHDYYRPMALARVRAGLDTAGRITGWSNRIVSPSILYPRFAPALPNGVDSQAVDGAIKLPYALGARLVEYVRHTTTAPVGFWRSVGHSINCFVVESAIDELALAANVDPLLFRQRLLVNAPAHLAVLNAAAQLGNWSSPPLAGRARGIALSEGFGSITAQVVEISAPVSGAVVIHRVSAAIDCGIAVNPDSVKAQMQGAIIQGLTAALWSKITFSQGRTVQRNFSNYRVMVMREAPRIDVTIVNQGSALGGVGEPGVPAAIPALVNAYARLTGTRIRSLPMFPNAGFMDD